MVKGNQRRSNTSRRRGRRQKTPPGVTIKSRGTSNHYPITEFLAPDFGTGLLQELQVANVTVRLVDLLDWPDEARFQALSVIAALGPGSIRTATQVPAHACLLNAVLSDLVGDDDTVRCERGRRAALETIALCHADAIEAACSKVAKRLKELGVRGVLPQSLVKAAKQLVLATASGQPGTPQALAERFLAQLNSDANILEGTALLYWRQEFYEWTGSVWLRLDDDQVMTRVTRWLQRERQGPEGAPINTHIIRDVIANLRGMVGVDANQLELPLRVESLTPQDVRPSNDIAFINGRVDREVMLSDTPLVDVELKPIDPRHFSTVTLPFEFDAWSECPLWVQTLQEIFPCRADDDHRIEVLQEFVGWTLVPGDMRFQKFLAMYGRGNNGKGLIMKIWTKLLGEANVSNVPLEHLNGEFRQIEMMGKLANFGRDMAYIDKVAEGQLKSLTSGDPIQVNRKNKPPITMVPTAKLVFATNDLPRFSDRSEGIWRRLVAMPFHHMFRQGRDEDLQRSEQLLPELPGIFLWAVEGARQLYAQGGFTACGECRRCAAEHRVHSDPLLQWWQTCAEADRHTMVRCEYVYSDYVTFCENNRYKAKNSSEFSKELLRHLRPCTGAPKRRFGPRRSRQYYYCGMRLIGGTDQNCSMPESDCRCNAVSNRCPTARASVGHT